MDKTEEDEKQRTVPDLSVESERLRLGPASLMHSSTSLCDGG